MGICNLGEQKLWVMKKVQFLYVTLVSSPVVVRLHTTTINQCTTEGHNEHKQHDRIEPAMISIHCTVVNH